MVIAPGARVLATEPCRTGLYAEADWGWPVQALTLSHRQENELRIREPPREKWRRQGRAI